MLGVLSLIFSIIVLIFLSFKGVSILIIAPLLSMGLAFITGDLPALYALTGPFMKVTSSYIGSYFPIFLGGAIFGKIMGDSGAARSISHFISEKLGKKRAILAVVLATSLLTYGGVSLFVVVFAIYPLGVALFQEADIPKRLMPAAIAIGAFTFTMTALPGSPQYINSMPTNYLNTNIYAAPILGTISGLIILIFGIMWLEISSKKAKAKGEGYGQYNDTVHNYDYSSMPSPFISILPIVIIFIVNWVVINIFFKSESFIAKFQQYGGLDGNWPVTIALMIAIAVSLILFRKQIKSPLLLLKSGAESSLSPIFNTAVIVGFGGVVKATMAFELIREKVLALNIPGLYKVAISTSIMAGITGSSSGGTGIALEALSKSFLEMGLNPEVIHRTMLIAAGGLDSLPHCGAVITLLAVCGIAHKDGYKDIGIVTVLIPIISLIFVIILHNITGIV
ncbi:GntP family permease [Cetobacterium sp.]|uniref:GntP family permease n=1 Tax=Cetobacterium sp. TaxID=2071632 RepID=UPI003AEF2D96